MVVNLVEVRLSEKTYTPSNNVKKFNNDKLIVDLLEKYGIISTIVIYNKKLFNNILKGRDNMQLSKFFKAIRLEEDVYAIFNTLLMDVVFVDKEEYEEILKLHFKSDFLISSGVYVQNESADKAALDIMQTAYKQLNKKVEILYLIVSTGCNLACKYCFEENSEFNNHKETNMSINVALKAVERYLVYLENTDIDKPQIIFYGGEPFVNWDTIKSVVQYVKSRNSKIKFNIVTNATLIDYEQATFIAENDIELGISLDGPKDINDFNRIYRNNENSVYDKVLENIGILKSANVKYGLSITISQTLIDNKKEVLQWLKSLNTQSIFYNLYHYGEKNDEWEKFYNDMSEYLIESYEYCSKIGIADGRFNRKVESLLDKKFKFSDCAAIGANQLTIKPNGDVIICHGYVKTDKYIIGNILKKDINELLEHKSVLDWQNDAPINKEECLDCDALFVCGGGCSMQSESLFGSINDVDKAFCIHSKKSLFWLLKKLYIVSKNNNLLKGEKKLC